MVTNYSAFIMQQPGGNETVEEEITDLFFAVIGRMKHHLVAAVGELGLTPQQAHALRCLVPGTPLPMRVLASELMCDASTVTGIVDRLEERGMVQRQPDPCDRRVKALVVTGAGAEARARLWERVHAEAPHVAALDLAERVLLRDLLAKIVQSEGPRATAGHHHR